MLTPEQLLEAMQELSGLGVLFAYGLDSGMTWLSTSDVLTLRQAGREQFLADSYGVSLDRYRAWREAADFCRDEGGLQCDGTTKKGRRCRKVTYDFDPYKVSPKDFDPDAPHYCHLHEPPPSVAEDAVDVQEREQWEQAHPRS